MRTAKKRLIFATPYANHKASEKNLRLLFRDNSLLD